MTDRDGDQMAASLLLDVADLITDDRNTHGDAVVNQEHIAAGWTWFLRGQGVLDADEHVSGTDVAFMMGLVKMSRYCVGSFDVDHLRDTAGYAAIGAACAVENGDASIDELSRGAYEDAHLGGASDGD